MQLDDFASIQIGFSYHRCAQHHARQHTQSTFRKSLIAASHILNTLNPIQILPFKWLRKKRTNTKRNDDGLRRKIPSRLIWISLILMWKSRLLRQDYAFDLCFAEPTIQMLLFFWMPSKKQRGREDARGKIAYTVNLTCIFIELPLYRYRWRCKE